MGIFKGLYELVCTPIAVVKDVITLGGVVIDEEPATKIQMEKIEEAFRE